MSDKKFIVTSLPRSGTTSISKMAEICGMKAIHILGGDVREKIIQYDFFSDTPFYLPEFLIGLIQMDKKFKYNFIYIDRHQDDVYKSIESFGLNKYFINEFKNIDSIDNEYDFLDAISWNYVHKNKKHSHKNIIIKLCEIYNIPLLIYNFNQGWEPFCDFIGKPTPKIQIPHLNKSGM